MRPLLLICTLVLLSTLHLCSCVGSDSAAAASPDAATRLAALLHEAGLDAPPAPTDSVSTLSLPNGSTYTGQVDDVRQPHGSGAVTDAAGVLVEGGRWAHGQMQGEGVRVFADGSRYSGWFERGAPHGAGVRTSADGSATERGHFVRGRLEGAGVHAAKVDGDAVTYEGQFKEGNKHGLGHEHRGSGFFEGEWSSGRMHGFGVVHVRGEGIVRMGRWKEGHFLHETPIPRRVLPRADFIDQQARTAEFIGLDGAGVSYVGERNERGEPHGAGDMLSAAGAKLQGGQWVDGLLHGRGFASSSDQSVYTGEFVEGMMHGAGELAWSDGDTFAGRFALDRRAGFGTMRHASDGSVYEGHWDDDMMHGHGVIVWAQDGAVCEAQFRANERHGPGAVWNGQGKLVGLGRWEEDELVHSVPLRRSEFTDGRMLTQGERASSLLYPDHTHYTGPLDENDKPHGAGTLRHHDGATISDATWEHGVCVQGQCATGAADDAAEQQTNETNQTSDEPDAAVTASANETAHDDPSTIVRDEL